MDDIEEKEEERDLSSEEEEGREIAAEMKEMGGEMRDEFDRHYP